MLLSLLVIFGCLVCLVFCYCLFSMSAPRNPQEQKEDDDEQIDYIKKWYDD